MKIIQLHAENFKRLKAVTIKPGDDPVVEISGRNSQGKSSAIDAIWVALQGASVLKDTPEPVRKGSITAEVVLDLGEYTVVRKFTKGGKNSYLSVTTADGAAKITSPQKLLDSLMGDLSFDPLKFTRLSDKEQAEALMAMLKIDIAVYEEERLRAYNERTAVNRDVARAKNEHEAIPEVPDAPNAVDIQDLLDEYQAASDRVSKVEKAKEHIEYVRKNLVEAESRLKNAKDNVKEWKVELSEALAAAVVDDMPDLDAIRAKVTEAEEINKKAAQGAKRAEAHDRLLKLEAESTFLTKKIDGAIEAKQQVLRSVAMPVEGMAINADSGLLEFNGIPLKQSSRSEQLKVAIAVAMAQHPELRVMRIEDASILDDDSLAALKQMAADNDYQLWVEIVDGTGEVGIYIEDGEISNK